MARTRRSYTLEFKQETVRLIEEQGLAVVEVGEDLGVCPTVIRRWLKLARAGKPLSASAQQTSQPAEPVDLEAENRRLRKEVAKLREEREILKKAAAFFAQESR